MFPAAELFGQNAPLSLTESLPVSDRAERFRHQACQCLDNDRSGPRKSDWCPVEAAEMAQSRVPYRVFLHEWCRYPHDARVPVSGWLRSALAMSLGVTPVDRVRLWEAQFRAMEREWGEISARWTRVRMAAWRGAMSEMRRQHGRLVSDGLWVAGPSDFLAIIDQTRAENTHSRILRWLLKPTGRHGLGCGLVRHLVEHCTGEPAPASLAVREVAFSQWRNDREADLVVWGEDFTLVIENKVDATEQPRQCDDLYANFKNEKAPQFLFLTPDGRKPGTATTPGALRAFRILSWPAVRTMIETALNESRPASADAGAVDVVRNYLRTLQEQFR